MITKSYCIFASAQHTFTPYNIWFEPYFSSSKQRNINTAPGYKAHTGGFIVGAEKELSPRLKLGLAAGYAYTKQQALANSQTHAIINNYITMLYGTNKYAYRTDFDWSISWGQNYYKGFRVVQEVPQTVIATANYSGAQSSAYGALSKRYSMDKFDLLPQINANVTYAKLPEYTETGAGVLGNTVPENTTTNLTLGAGVQAEWPPLEAQRNIITEVHGLAYYDVNLQTFNLIPSSIIGQPALNTTSSTYRTIGRIGGSYKYNANKHFSIKAEYDLEFRNRYYNNIFFLILKYIF